MDEVYYFVGGFALGVAWMVMASLFAAWWVRR